MFKILLLEYLKTKLKKEKAKYFRRYLSYLFIAIGFILLIIVNFFYFYHEPYYNEANMVLLLGSSTCFIAIGLIISIVNYFSKPAISNYVPDILTRSPLLGNTINNLEKLSLDKLISYLPKIARIIPICIIIFIVYKLLKRSWGLDKKKA